MLFLSWQLTVLSLFMLPVFLWLTVKVGRARREVATSTQKTLADLTSITEETLSRLRDPAVEVVRPAAPRDRPVPRGERAADRLQIRQTMIGRRSSRSSARSSRSRRRSSYLVAGWVTRRQPGGDHGRHDRRVHDAAVAPVLPDRVDAAGLDRGPVLDGAVRPDLRVPRHGRTRSRTRPTPSRSPPTRCAGASRLRDVWFRYETPPPRPTAPGLAVGPRRAAANEAPREWTLEDVSLEIEPGQLAALVGPSGAGKTTITYLVPRLYDVQRGRGRDRRRSTCATSRSSRSATLIGVVTQETYLFHTTIRRNLLYGRPDATQEEIEAAARAANIHDRIAELAGGLRHGRRRARLQALGRREAAPRDRARDPEGPADPDPGRGDVVARHDLGAAGAGGARAADARPDDDRDRPPPVDDPVGRRDLRRRPRPDRRARDARRAARARGGCTRGCTSSSSAAAWSQAECEDGVILSTGEVVRTASG